MSKEARRIEAEIKRLLAVANDLDEARQAVHHWFDNYEKIGDTDPRSDAKKSNDQH